MGGYGYAWAPFIFSYFIFNLQNILIETEWGIKIKIKCKLCATQLRVYRQSLQHG